MSVQGSRFRIWGFGFRVWGARCTVRASEFGRLGFKAAGLECRVLGSGTWLAACSAIGCPVHAGEDEEEGREEKADEGDEKGYATGKELEDEAASPGLPRPLTEAPSTNAVMPRAT